MIAENRQRKDPGPDAEALSLPEYLDLIRQLCWEAVKNPDPRLADTVAQVIAERIPEKLTAFRKAAAKEVRELEQIYLLPDARTGGCQ